MITIVNLTPHPVTIIRRCPDPNGPPEAIIEHRTEYPACAPADLPRAIESTVMRSSGGAVFAAPGSRDDGQPAELQRINIGDMALSDSGSDGQGGYENSGSLQSTGLVDFFGYVGVENLPEVSVGDRMFGLTTFRIVSIVTALGALAAGRGIEDLLVPMGQVRDDNGRIVGASGLAPATSLLTPLYRALTGPHVVRTIEALQERNAARRDLTELHAGLVRDGRQVGASIETELTSGT